MGWGAKEDTTVPMCLPAFRVFAPKEIETIVVPVKNPKDPKSKNAVLANLPIIFPHRVISYLWDVVGLRIADEQVQEFWTHAFDTGDPTFEKFRGVDCTHRVPLGLYGDEAQLFTQHKKEKWLGVFIDLPLFRPRSIRSSRYLVFSIDANKVMPGRTLNWVMRTLVWSFNALDSGVNPDRGVGAQDLLPHQQHIAGRPISESCPHQRFSLCEIRGDWRYHRDLWQFQNHGKHQKCVSGARLGHLESTVGGIIILGKMHRGFPMSTRWKNLSRMSCLRGESAS